MTARCKRKVAVNKNIKQIMRKKWIKEVRQSIREIENGDCYTFSSVEEAIKHLNSND